MTSELFNSCPSVFVHKVRNFFVKQTRIYKLKVRFNFVKDNNSWLGSLPKTSSRLNSCGARTMLVPYLEYKVMWHHGASGCGSSMRSYAARALWARILLVANAMEAVPTMAPATPHPIATARPELDALPVGIWDDEIAVLVPMQSNTASTAYNFEETSQVQINFLNRFYSKWNIKPFYEVIYTRTYSGKPIWKP